ncbi:VaFE repeat-containing surface-anchored protein [Corynebacterium lehmanniae]|uniref:VaFE repeat-containing surface-anchored protein n=1 Tax=Corynebacterium haemomassiliense TaxID=2754726 RepID=UPI00370D0E15
MKLDDSDEIVNLDDGNKIGEFGYISQRLERRDIDEDNEPTGRTDENYAIHDGKNFESQRLYPYHGFVPPTMGTSASFVDGKFDNKRVDYVEIPEGEEAPAVVYDKVYFTNLAPGITYSVTGQLMSKSTGEPLGGEASSAEFTVDKLRDKKADDTGGYSGWISVAVPREKALEPGEEAVVFETLHAFAEKKDGKLVSADSKMEIAKHHDLDDEAQTVAVDKEVPRFAPKVRTSASLENDLFDGERVAKASSATTVYDKVYLEDLVPGVEYTLKGQLVSRSYPYTPYGDEVSMTVTPDETWAEGSFPDSVSGSVVMEIPVSDQIEDGDAVVFERLYFNDLGTEKLVADHADPNDAAQIITIDKSFKPVPSNPKGKIATKVSVNDVEASKDAPVTVKAEDVADGLDFKDTITYTDLVAGMKYRFEGQLQLVDGEKVTPVGGVVSKDIVAAENGSGTADVDFKNVEGLKPGATYVVYEKAIPLDNEGNPTTDDAGKPNDSSEDKRTVIEHEDPSDKAQTFVVENPEPSIKTQAEFKDGATEIKAGTVVVDTVTYTNLVAGKTYTLNAKLVDKQDENNVLGTGAVTFTAEGNDGDFVNGKVNVDITVGKGVELKDENPVLAAVAFEYLTSTEVDANGKDNPQGAETEEDSSDDNQIAKHDDINDEAQTVRTVFEPSIKTNAKFQDGSTEVVAGNTVIDTVDYEGLVPGKKYTLSAKLMERRGEAGSYEAGRVLGEGTATFTPETTDGSVEVEIKVNDDVTEPVPAAVAFEYLTSEEVNAAGEETDGETVNDIAKHDDITDEAQTVRTVFEPSIKTNAKFQDGSTEVAAGNTVIDTVDYEGLVPGKEYTLSAKLMERRGEAGSYEAGRVLGEGTATFPASETGAGSVEVTIKVSDDVTEPVPAAVAFEELTSTEVDKTGQDNPQGGNTPDDYSDDNKIAEHKDINDGNQTVEGPVDTPTPTTQAPSSQETSPAVPLVPTTVTTTVKQGYTPNPKIETRAEFKDGVNVVQNGTTVEDTVRYYSLVAGKTYTLDAKLVDKQDENKVLGTGAVTFVVPGDEGELVNGNVKVEIAVTNAPNPVQAAVAFERLTSKEVNAAGEETDGEKTNDIAKHEDINDEAQTVRSVFEPSIATNAKFQDGSTEVAAGNTVIDTVDYKGLVPGKEYTLSAQLINKADGKTVVGTGTKTFTPKTTDGSVEVEITVNDDVTEPVDAAVAFEELTSTVVDKTGQDNPQGGDTPETSDDNKIAEHKDINDANQTVGVPHISTNANFAEGSAEVTNGAVVVDTVSYAGLVPGKEYTLTAQLIDKADGTTVLGTGTKTFTPTEPNDSVDVEITVDNAPDDRTVTAAVAFEELTSKVVDRGGNENPKGGNTPDDYSDDNKIAEHKEINDQDQTVRNPKISTNANFANGAQEVKNGVAVVDTVTYEGLVPGKVYTLTADLINKADGETVLGSGNKTFIPTEPNGSEDVTIVVSNAPEGETVTAAVAFEKLTSTQVDRAGKENPKGGETRTTDDDNKIAEHTDLNDEAQTVRSPRIATNANFADGAKQVENGTVVVDTVDYSGLVKGKTYTLTAELKERLGEAAPYGVGRTIGTGTETFQAPAENGSVDVRITVDGLEDGEQVAAAVAFEELTSTEVDRGGDDAPNEGGNKIAEHKDINDGNQTVEGPVNTTTPATTAETTTVTETTTTGGASSTKTAGVSEETSTTSETTSTTEPTPATETTTTETTSEATPTTVASTTVTVPAEPTTGESTTTTEPAPTTEVTTTEATPTTMASTTVTVPVEPTTGESTTTTEPAPTTEVTTSEATPTTEATTTDATTAVTTTSVAEPSTSETAPSSTPVVPLVPSNPEGKIDTKVTVNGKTIVDGKPVTVTEQDVTNGLRVTDEITYSGLVAGAKYRFEGQLQHVEFNEAGEVVKVTPVTEVKFTDVLAAENGAGTATVDFGTLTELTAGETYVVYEQAIPLDENDQPTTNPDGTPKDPSKDNRKVVEHKDPKDKAQTFVVEKTPTTSPTAPVAPSTTPDNCVPATTVSTVPGTTVPETTVPGTTGPGTTAPGSTVPGTTVEESTTEVTTVPETCASTTEEKPTPATSEEPTTTVPAQPTTSEQTTEPTKVTTSEQPTKPTTPVVPSNTTTPVVPPVVWFPNPQIGTTADFANGATEVVSGTVVNDTVKYQGLVPGKTYTLTAELVSKDVYNELVNRDAYGDAIIGTGTKTFTASETGNGSVVVEIPVVDGIDTPVRAAVAFETLTSTEVDREGNDNPQGGETPNDVSDDNPIAEHKNINDQNQTVRSSNVPETSEPFIGTNANFADGAKQVVAGATVVDTVRYTGLVPGKTYTLTADLVAKGSGAIIGQGEKQFVASEAGYGSVNVDITVASWVTNPVYAAVAFERLTSTEVDAQGNDQPAGNRVPQQIAEHRDINDAAQTVITPGISEGRDVPGEPGVSTNADFSKGAEVVNGAVVRDVVKYWGLVPGATYTATAQLMERLGESAPYTEGRVLGTQSVTFTPEAAYGEIVVEIPVTNAEGAVPAAVAFETLTSTEVDRNGDENPKGGNTPDDVTDDNQIAEHKDINDGYQTVKTSEGNTPPAEETTPATTTPSTTTPGAPAEETTPASSTPAPSTTPGEEGSSADFDKKKLWWLLLIPGLGMIPAVLGGGNGSSKPAPKPTPAPQESKPAPAPSNQPAPSPVGKPVPADSPRGEIKQIPSGGTVLEKDMPAYI